MSINHIWSLDCVHCKVKSVQPVDTITLTIKHNIGPVEQQMCSLVEFTKNKIY